MTNGTFFELFNRSNADHNDNINKYYYFKYSYLCQELEIAIIGQISAVMMSIEPYLVCTLMNVDAYLIYFII